MLLRLTTMALALAAATAAHAQTGATTSITNRGGGSAIDYENAIPKALPKNVKQPASQLELLQAGEKTGFSGESGFEPGERGDGAREPVTLPKSKVAAPVSDEVGSEQYGTSNQPFTTSYERRPDLDPYRRAGKLFFRDGGGSYICSASLIKRGVVVTAAHCVSEFGKNRFYTGFEYVPAYSDGDAPYGVWDWRTVIVPTVYLRGTDKCSVKGVVCQSDVAVIVLAPKSGRYAGHATGFFGYAFGGYSYTPSKQALITQLGYPASLNGGREMMRTDSQGAVDSTQVGNTVIGSLQTGGSSGGPWLVNFGTAPTPAGNPFGADPKQNVVVGATSWGYVNSSAVRKQQGASFFTSKNIKTLVDDACKAVPAACK